jgi:hypothetical protein
MSFCHLRRSNVIPNFQEALALKYGKVSIETVE